MYGIVLRGKEAEAYWKAMDMVRGHKGPRIYMPKVALWFNDIAHEAQGPIWNDVDTARYERALPEDHRDSIGPNKPEAHGWCPAGNFVFYPEERAAYDAACGGIRIELGGAA